MITQKKIKEWIPEAVEAFRAVMPPIDKENPAVYIASGATLCKVRNELIRLTGSTSYETNTPYSAIMEYIHGDKGDAILVYQKHCLNDLKDFQHTLWHSALFSEWCNLYFQKYLLLSCKSYHDRVSIDLLHSQKETS